MSDEQLFGAAPKKVVGVMDYAISSHPDDIIVTHALGSCIGLTIHDPVAGVAAMLHYLLPHSKVNPDKAASNPAMFGDTGIPMVFREIIRLGCKKSRAIVRIAGGAQPEWHGSYFNVGRKNYEVAVALLNHNGVRLAGSDVGGTRPRTMSIKVGSGEVSILSDGERYQI